MDKTTLIEKAFIAKEKAYAPYSKFRVGAVLVTKDGKIYEGANVENASYGLSMCAERTAAFAAKLDGASEFETIVITSDSNDFTYPCGACRQVLVEICGEDLEVILARRDGVIKSFKLKELLPYSFGKKQLNDK
jgi:cytidine deaminase